jgi:DNA-directed RNA polymerase subunit K/omega
MNRINKFDMTRILSARALELAEGAKPKVDLEGSKIYLGKDYVEVAKRELDEGVLDLEVYKMKIKEEKKE